MAGENSPPSFTSAAPTAARRLRDANATAEHKAAAGMQPRFGADAAAGGGVQERGMLRYSKTEAIELATERDGGRLKVKRDVSETPCRIKAAS